MTYQPPKDYVEVNARVLEFRKKHPEGTLQSRIVELPPAFADSFVAVEARAYRTPDDPMPGYGLAWEPVPGKTPYTKDSELMNAETSAWGRALIAVGAADAKKGIASANEVRNRASDAPPSPGARQKAGSGSPGTAPEPAATSTGGAPSSGLLGEGASSGTSGGELHRPCGGVYLPMVSRDGWVQCSKCSVQKKAHA